MIGELTGSATASDVASSAAMSVMMHRLMKAAMKRQPGWNFSGSDTSDFNDTDSDALSGVGCGGGISSLWLSLMDGEGEDAMIEEVNQAVA